MQTSAYSQIIFFLYYVLLASLWNESVFTTTYALTTIPSNTCSTNNGNHNDRNLESLLNWASKNNVQFSPAISLETAKNSNDGDESNGGDVGLILNKSLKNESIILSVPRSIVLDSQEILHSNFPIDSWQSKLLQESVNYISLNGFEDSKLNFVLMVKVLYEYSLGEESSRWYPWLKSLPKKFHTGIEMNDVELKCLPNFGIALADYERKKFRVFSQALKQIIKKSSEKEQQEHQSSFFFGSINPIDEERIIAWAFNVVQSRSWTYTGDEEGENERPIIVPLGDLFNHKVPANIMVDDNILNDSDKIHFKLTQDLNLSTTTTTTPELYLSYGFKHNPYRFLIIFGFFDPTMPEIWCEILFTNPSKEMIELGCEDRSKMTYGTKDGLISQSVWDTVLYSLLDQVPAEQKVFYSAHLENDEHTKKMIHDKYIMETSLALRKHVMKTLNELKPVLMKTEEIFETSNYKHQHYPRLAMIHEHNMFLYRTFDMVRQRIDERAKEELKRRKKSDSK